MLGIECGTTKVSCFFVRLAKARSADRRLESTECLAGTRLARLRQYPAPAVLASRSSPEHGLTGSAIGKFDSRHLDQPGKRKSGRRSPPIAVCGSKRRSTSLVARVQFAPVRPRPVDIYRGEPVERDPVTGSQFNHPVTTAGIPVAHHCLRGHSPQRGRRGRHTVAARSSSA